MPFRLVVVIPMQMTATGDGERAAIIHPDMRVYQTTDRIYAQVR